MERKIFFSLEDYKANYEAIKNEFIDAYVDNDEITFISDQINLYKTCKKNSEVITLLVGGCLIEDTDANLRGWDIIQEVGDAIKINGNRKEIDFEKAKKYTLSFNKIIDYLTDKIEKENIAPGKLSFIGKKTEFVELIKALHENGNFGNRPITEVYNVMSNFFNIELGDNPSKFLTDIKKRDNGSETLFIDKLKFSLYNHITKKD